MYLIYKNSNSNSKYIDYENGINVTSNGALRVKLTYKICYTFINFVLAFRRHRGCKNFLLVEKGGRRKEEDRVILKTFVIQGKTGFSGAISGISVTSGGWNGEIIPMKWCSTGGERKLRVSVVGSLIRQMNRDASEREFLLELVSFQMTLDTG